RPLAARPPLRRRPGPAAAARPGRLLAGGGPPRVLAGASQRGRPARRAAGGVGFAAVAGAAPANGRGRERGGPLALWAVRAWEQQPPAGAGPIDRLLLTDVPVGGVAGAWERVGWYACRMVVEDYHKGMKTGVGVEQLQLTRRDR